MNNRGSGLVGAFLVSLTSLSLFYLALRDIQVFQKTEIGQKQGTSVKVQLREIRDLLHSKPACYESFSGLDVTAPTSVAVLKDHDGHDKILTGSFVRESMVQIEDFRVENFRPYPDKTREGVADLVVSFQRSGEGYAAHSFQETQTLYVETNSAMRITYCHSLSGDGGSWTKESDRKISYTEGFVGVGTQDPQAPFDVQDERISWGDGAVFSMSGDNKDFYLNNYSNCSGAGCNSAFNFYRAKGSYKNPVFLTSGHRIGSIGFSAWDGSKFLRTASITSEVYGASTFGKMAAHIDFKTSDPLSDGMSGGQPVLKTRMSVWNTGRVGIGTPALFPPRATLHVMGGDAVRGDGKATWDIASDARLKEVHGSYKKGLREIAALEPVRFSYKKDTPYHFDPNKEFVGLDAAKTQKIFPEAVKENEDGYLQLNITAIVWAMINAIKELGDQADETDELKADLDRDEKDYRAARAETDANLRGLEERTSLQEKRARALLNKGARDE